MALVKGMGSCAIPQANNLPCGGQIQEGEPIGTVIAGFANEPMIGHKRCADAYNMRKRQETQVKIGKQGGPGGSIGDPQNYPDALAFGSVPLEKEEPPAPDLAAMPMPEGVKPLSELPMDDEPAPAPEPERNIYRDGNHPVPVPSEDRGDRLPAITTRNGQVVLSDIAVNRDGFLHLNPQDAYDFAEILQLHAKRAARNQSVFRP